MNYHGPKKYLSYSQIRLWLDDKEKYRARYYRGETDAGSKALLFGSEISKMLEDGTFVLPAGLQYPEREYEIVVDIDGVPMLMWLDTFDPTKLKFREYKTGSLKTDGKDRWNDKAVKDHFQLDVYSLGIQVKHGSVDDECHLDWLEVKNKIKYMDFAGMKLESKSNDLELSGRIESFTRVITQNERDRARAVIVSVAKEIEADFKSYNEKNGIQPTR